MMIDEVVQWVIMFWYMGLQVHESEVYYKCVTRIFDPSSYDGVYA